MNYHIPTEDRADRNGQMVEGSNQYKCLAVPLENVTSISPPFDIVAGLPIRGSRFLHHFVNSVCEDDPRPDTTIPYGQDGENDISDCAMGNAQCSSIPGYAVGGSAYVAPSDTGIRVAAGAKWVLFNTHFYNPSMDKEAYDSSGYDYFVTKELRSKVQGTFSFGMSPTMKLAAGLVESHYT